MQEPQDGISGIQLAMLLTISLIGVRALAMPRDVTIVAGTGGWLSISLAGGLTTIFLVLSMYNGFRFPGQSPFDYFPVIWGSFFGKLLNYMFIFFYAVVVGVNLRIFGDVVKVTILPATPLEVIIATKLLVVVYLVRHGVAPMARLAEAFVPLIIAPLAVLMLLGIGSVHYEWLLPPLSQGVVPAIKGTFPAYLSFTGYGVAVFLMPYLRKRKSALKGAFVGIALAFVVYLVSWSVSLAQFGETEMTFISYPLLEVAKTVRVPGGFLARYEIILIASWVLASVGLTATPYFIAAQGLARELKLKDPTPVVWLLVPIIYLAAIFPANLPAIQGISNLLGIGSLGLSILLIASLVMAIWRGKGESSGNAG